MITLFHTFLVDPIYNLFVYLIGILPGGDVGFAIIILTLLVRAVFYPAFASSIRTQMAMQVVQPQLQQINERFKDDREERARQQMELFRKHRIHPFSLIGTSIIQLLVFFTLAYVFYRIGLPEIRTDLLYPFVHVPQIVDEYFLGIDLTKSHAIGNIILAIIVTGLQYLVIKLSLSRAAIPEGLSQEKQTIQKMQRQMMLYFLPVLMAFTTFSFPAAAGLYIATTNVVSLGQEWLLRRKPL